MGNFVKGLKEGFGKFHFVDGSMYEGNFKAGVLDGEGHY